jgi:hypothetical protein
MNYSTQTIIELSTIYGFTVEEFTEITRLAANLEQLPEAA